MNDDKITKIMKGNDCCEHCIYAGIELGRSEAEEHAGSYSSSCNCRHCRMCRVLEKRGKSELLDELISAVKIDKHGDSCECFVFASLKDFIDEQRAKLKEAKG